MSPRKSSFRLRQIAHFCPYRDWYLPMSRKIASCLYITAQRCIPRAILSGEVSVASFRFFSSLDTVFQIVNLEDVSEEFPRVKLEVQSVALEVVIKYA